MIAKLPPLINRASLGEYAARFQRRFPALPPFPAFISMISSTPAQFKDLLPSGSISAVTRHLYMDALIWLLRQDLVVQMHTRARIFARPEIKEKAWRTLWHRRRSRWLGRLEKSPDLITPRAADGLGDPMDSTVPGPKMDASHLVYDSDLDNDSDLGEGDMAHPEMAFAIDVSEPQEVPSFTGSFIFKPARAHKDEARWLRVIRESADEVWASKFDL